MSLSEAAVPSASGSSSSSPAPDMAPPGSSGSLTANTLLEASEEFMDLKMSWSGKVFDISIAKSDLIYDLKLLIWSLTSVPVERQKIMGLTTLKIALQDNVLLSDLKIKKNCKFMMIGTPEELTFKDPSQVPGLPPINSDWDMDYAQVALPAYEDPRNLRKMKEAFDKLDINVINVPRPNKRLLVLDLDYTLVDTRPLVDGSLPAAECARPNMHSFLEKVYEEYDICIWSQTSWRWLEAKLSELGFFDSERSYRISFVVDRRPMFKVFGKKDGQEYSHEVKALKLLWDKFPDNYSAANSIHIDDLSRNFAMNPKSGLKIKAFKGAGTGRELEDKELERLGRYLMQLAQLPDFTQIEINKSWSEFRKMKPN